MSEVKKGTTKAMALIPTKDEALKAGTDMGGVALGIIGIHTALTMAKKRDSYLVDGGLVVGGLYGAMKVKKPFFRALCIGAGIYGIINASTKVAKEVATPGTTGAIGALPQGVKDALIKYVPSFAGIDELSGEEEFSGIENLSLDDQGMQDEPMRGLNEQYEMNGMNGMGSLAA